MTLVSRIKVSLFGGAKALQACRRDNDALQAQLCAERAAHAVDVEALQADNARLRHKLSAANRKAQKMENELRRVTDRLNNEVRFVQVLKERKRAR